MFLSCFSDTGGVLSPYLVMGFKHTREGTAGESSNAVAPRDGLRRPRSKLQPRGTRVYSQGGASAAANETGEMGGH